MTNTPAYLLTPALVGLMAYAAWTDIRRREIDNWVNGTIALLAPLFWLANEYAVWPDMAMQLAIGVTTLFFFAILFAIGAMGGGDVKMIAALALWLPISSLLPMLFVMALAGGALTIIMLIAHKVRKSAGILEIPYGVAIAAGGIFVSANNILTSLQH